MKLDDKITSLEDFLKIPECRDYQYDTNSGTKSHQFFYAGIGVFTPRVLNSTQLETTGQMQVQAYLPSSAWWWLREMMRFQRDEDAYGPVLAMLWRCGYLSVWCPKPHKADLTKIEFYPDAAAGMAERPIVTSLAKFLRRMSPLFTDEYIRDLDAAHRACMSNELEILTGIEGFREAYTTGPHSCMSTKWQDATLAPYYAGNHPVDAYADIPGIGMAVSRVGGVPGKGAINGRCIVYTNPDDPKDMRAVRVYGDSSLRSRLLRAGYKFKPLTGLSLKMLPITKRNADNLGITVPKGVTAVYAPYLDGPEGKHDAAEAARHLIWIEGEERLRMVTSATANNLLQAARAKGIAAARAGQGNSSGIATVGAIPKEIVVHTCPITGKVTDLMTEALGPLQQFWVNGAMVSAALTSELSERFTHNARLWVEDIGWTSVRFSAEDKPAVFKHERYDYVDDETNRRRLHYVPWAPQYADKAGQWVNTQVYRYHSAAVEHIVIDGLAYLPADCMEVIQNDPAGFPGMVQRRWVLKSAELTASLVRVHSQTRGVEMWAMPNVKTVKTRTGRTVIPNFHPVVELWDGTYAFERVCVCSDYLGQSIWRMRDEPMPDLPVDHKIVKQALEAVASQAQDDRHLFGERSQNTNWEQRLWFYVRRLGGYQFTSNRVRGHHYFVPSDVDLHADLAFIRSIIADDTPTAPLAKLLVKAYRIARQNYINRFAEWQLHRERRGYRIQTFTYEFIDLSLPNDPDTLPTLPVREPATPMEALQGVAPPPQRLSVATLAAMSAEELNALPEGVVREVIASEMAQNGEPIEPFPTAQVPGIDEIAAQVAAMVPDHIVR